MLSEIGSNYWINPNEFLKNKPLGTPEQFGCKGNDYVWLSTGRSAISYVIKTIEERHPDMKKVALLPPFTCHTVIEPFLNAGYEVHHYPIDEKMMATEEGIMDFVRKYDAYIVLFHRYFGFNTLPDMDGFCEELRCKRRYTIEDSTQCLYSNRTIFDVDFFVGSIRKWHGTPDGGFATCRDFLFGEKPIQYDETLDEAKVKASYAKYKYLFENKGNKSEFLQLYRKAEDVLESQTRFFAICQTSRMLQSNLNVIFLRNRRKSNYQTMLSGLAEIGKVRPVFEDLTEDVVPLYFPIIVEDRASLQSYLVKNNIYAPIVWPKPDCLNKVCEQAEYFYEHLLCIPIDQRYDEVDMNRVVETINKYYQENYR